MQTKTVMDCHYSSQDVATDNLLDFEDSVNVVVETNGNVEDDQLDNHRPAETNNNPPAWVRSPNSRLCVAKYNKNSVFRGHKNVVSLSMFLVVSQPVFTGNHNVILYKNSSALLHHFLFPGGTLSQDSIFFFSCRK